MTSAAARTNYVISRYHRLYNRIGFSDNNQTKVLLIGDSFSQDFYNIILEAGFFNNAAFRTSYVGVACQIYRGEEDPFGFIEKANRPLCENLVYNDRFISMQDMLAAEADIVIFAANWQKWSAERLRQTIDNMPTAQTARIIVIGRKDFGAIAIKEYLNIPIERRSALRNEVSPDHLETNAIMRREFENQTAIEFVDLHEIICGEASPTCPVFTPEGLLISYDGAHLTEAGAKHIGSLFPSPLLKLPPPQT
ncbi:MAG: hypothetical protein LBT81_02835 [Helicobacteraceae bacterium]|nr:hypothetical protein [Helicobacteraceae bacterium]